MGKHTDQRDRTLLLAHMLYEETDEKHPLPLSALAARLAREGVAAERKSLYRDIAALKRHGFAVEFRAGVEGGWYLNQRTFTAADLRAVIDAVAVYHWLPEDQRAALLDKLAGLAPAHQRKSLRRPVTVRHRSARSPEKVREVLDRIYAACQSGRALSFIPWSYDRTKAAARQVVSPKHLLWEEDGYRLLGWDHREKTVKLYRPDRMCDVLVTGLPAQGPDVNPDLWTAAPFGLDPVRRERVRLRIRPEAVGDVLDRFGADAALIPDGDSFLLTADVVIGRTFWGWMTAHSESCHVIAPPWAARLWTERYQPRNGGRTRQEKPVRSQSRVV